MLVMLIERSNGGCYFIAAKFADRACQGTPQLSWCCRYHNWNGLEHSALRGRISFTSGPPGWRGAKRTEIVTFHL